MGLRRMSMVLCTVLLIVLAVLCGVTDTRMHPQTMPIQEQIPVSFLLEAGGTTRRIVPWFEDAGKGYVFLPSCGSLQRTILTIDGNGTLTLDGKTMESGTSCGELALEEDYLLVYADGSGVRETVITFLQSENLPAVYVDTKSGSLDYIHKLKEYEESGRMQIFLPEGNLQFSGSLRAFGGRGNATWELDKKPYKLELDQEADILGMGSAKNWILLANSFDPSHIRNKIVYEAARKADLAFSPESRWVDLYLNGSYAGLYLLCEKNEIHPRRVDIDENTGVLISIEKEDRLWEYGDEQFVTDHGIPIRVRHGSEDMAAVQQKLRTLENAVLSQDGVDPQTGKHWSELIDVDSWVKKYLIEEVFGNLDAGSISQFFYWEDDGKIYAGPVWDYDISMGNPNNWQLDAPQMLYSGRPHLWNPEDTPWFYGLYQKPEFQAQVVQCYEQVFRPMLQRLLEEEMADFGVQVNASAMLDRIRWHSGDGTDAIAQMHSYMTDRMAFLDSLWTGEARYHLVSVYIKEHVMACYAVRKGEYMAPMPVPTGTDTIIYEAWYDGDTDQPFDFTSPVTGDKLIYLKETNLLDRSGEDGGFSLRKAVTYAPAAVLVGLLLAAAAVDWHVSKRDNRRRK